MIVITLARKPMKSSTTDCILQNGCGGLNINKTRIALASGDDCSRKPTKKEGCKGSGGWKNASEYTGTMNDDWKKGRWPANLLLAHTENCTHKGFKQVASNGNFPSQQNTSSLYMASKGKTLTPNISHHKDRKETVEHWECAENCPVSVLDAQSGISKSTGGLATGGMGKKGIYGSYAYDKLPQNVGGLGDTGGASRYFKIFGDKK